MKIKFVKYTWIIIGLIFFAIGTIGAFLPILPTFPFYIEKIANRKGLPLRQKVKIIIFFTLTMGIGFYFMKNTKIGRIILGIVWVFHVIYFVFGIKTIKSNENEIEYIEADMN